MNNALFFLAFIWFMLGFVTKSIIDGRRFKKREKLYHAALVRSWNEGYQDGWDNYEKSPIHVKKAYEFHFKKKTPNL